MLLRKSIFLSLSYAVLLHTSGCSTAPAPQAVSATPAPPAAVTTGATQTPAVTATPPASLSTPATAASPEAADAYAPLSPSVEMDKAIVAALKTGDKKEICAAYLARGDYRTTGDPSAGQRVKYRAALSDYRNAVKADKSNKSAAAGKSQIEQIYTMMGRPIPSVEECDGVSKTGIYYPKKP